MIKQYAVSEIALTTPHTDRTVVAGHDFSPAIHWRIVEAVNIVHGDVRLELYVIDPFTGRSVLSVSLGSEREMEVAWRVATGQNQIPWEVRR